MTNIENMFGGLRRRMMMKQEDIKSMEYRLINSVTTEEAMNRIDINTDSDGNPFALDDFVIAVVGTCDHTASQNASIILNGRDFVNSFAIPKSGTDTNNHGGICWNDGMVVQSDCAAGSAGAVSGGNASKTYVKSHITEKITSVGVKIAAAAYKFEAGTTVTIYGR